MIKIHEMFFDLNAMNFKIKNHKNFKNILSYHLHSSKSKIFLKMETFISAKEQRIGKS